MTSRGYVQRLVARHAEPLALRPRVTPRFAPSPRATVDADRGAPTLDIERPSGLLADSVTAVRRNISPDDAVRHRHPVANPRGRPGRTTTSASEQRVASDAAPDDSRAEAVDVAPAAGGRSEIAGDMTEFASHVARGGDGHGTRVGIAGDVMPHSAGRKSPRPDNLAEIEGRAAPPASMRHRARELERDSKRVDMPDSVHVHIGRIEVRAVMPPSERPSVSPRPAGPEPLSLDSYLARRAPR